MNQRGFTLLEVLVAAAIGAFGIAVAAAMVQTAVRQSGRGTQVQQLGQTVRLVGQQLRADLELAGLGSTGAIAADCSNQLWQQVCLGTPGAGFSAIPAVRGANAVPTTPVGGSRVLAGSDALMLVVPDPTTLARTTAAAARGTGRFSFATDNPFPPCPSRIAYVTDHSAPNGAGRAHVVEIGGLGGVTETSADTLQFTISEGADVMCARISTYWVDDEGWLRRSDAAAGVVVVPVGDVTIPDYPAGTDRIVPGAVDFQVAYKFSSEAVGRTATLDDRWAFDGTVAPIEGTLRTAPAAQRLAAWFEVRQARFNVHLRSLRAVDEAGVAIADANPIEDRAPRRAVPRGYGQQVVRTSALITNLRYFDMNAPEGLAAEPY